MEAPDEAKKRWGPWGNHARYVRMGGRLVAVENPAATTVARGLFTYAATDPDGANDIEYVQVNFSNPQSAYNSCYVHYDPAVNVFYLLNDEATVWFGLNAGTDSKVGNSQCQLHGLTSGAVKSGNNVTVTLDISFHTSFAGVKNSHLYYEDFGGHVTGWQQTGTWNVVGDPHLPEAASFTPASGSGTTQVFTVTWRDGDGYANLWYDQFSINAGLNAYNGCYIHNDPINNIYWRMNDNGTDWYGLHGGQAGSVQNSQCILRGPGSSRTLSGTDAVITFDIQFKPGFTGLKDIYVLGVDQQGNLQQWNKKGAWTVQ